MLRTLAFATGITILATSLNANTFSFTNVSYTANSVTFTIDGDMSGYAAPGLLSQFSIRFSDNMIANGGNILGNLWSASVFDNFSLTDNGNSGYFGFSDYYSWSDYNGNLSTASASNRIVTLTLPGNALAENTPNAMISFLWGNGRSDQDSTVLQKVTIDGPAPVPVPATLPLLAGAVVGLVGLARNRRRRV